MKENIIFGRYIQSGKTPEPLEWIVLNEKDGAKLLISKYVIEAMHFHNKYEETTWARCSLRKW